MTDLKDILAKYGVPDPKLVSKLDKGNGIKLDYVGHADITRLLIEIDPGWSWEPVAWDANGRPCITEHNGQAVMWARLTVLGKSMLGAGSVALHVKRKTPTGQYHDEPKQDIDKELIGDFLRNSAFRFGICLSLWTKSEWEHDAPAKPRQTVKPPADVDALVTDDNKDRFKTACTAAGLDWVEIRASAGIDADAWDELRQSGLEKLRTAYGYAKTRTTVDKLETAFTEPEQPFINNDTPDPNEYAPILATSKQLVALRAIFRGMAYTETEQTDAASQVVDRTVRSLDDLTKKEASQIIGKYSPPKT